MWEAVFRRIVESGLFSVCAMLLATYVGGVGLGLVMASTFILWLTFNAYEVLPSHLRYLGALLVTILNFVSTFNTVMPVMKSFQFLRHRIVNTQRLVETELFLTRLIETIHLWFVLPRVDETSVWILTLLVSVGILTYNAPVYPNSRQFLFSLKKENKQM